MSSKASCLEELWSQHPLQNQRLDPLQERLGYVFKDINTLRQALTHRSALQKSLPGEELYCYERLEFLGDAMLGALVAAKLWQMDEKSTEGELSMRRSSAVSEEALAAVASHLELEHAVVLGPSEARLGRSRPALRADCFEAIVGAVYSDSDFNTMERIFLGILESWWESAEFTWELAKDSKSLLQEFSQGRYQFAPSYELVGVQGPNHNRMFHVTVRVKDVVKASGWGSSKKRASQAAAEAALELLKLRKEV